MAKLIASKDMSHGRHAHSKGDEFECSEVDANYYVERGLATLVVEASKPSAPTQAKPVTAAPVKAPEKPAETPKPPASSSFIQTAKPPEVKVEEAKRTYQRRDLAAE